MNKMIIAVLALTASTTAMADEEFGVNRSKLGLGTPAQNVTVGLENASHVSNGMYFVPQYMPGYPTAATIFPRAVEVDCETVDGQVKCDGYNWTPNLGRGEYLFIVPKPKAPIAPVAVVVKETTVFKEVPVKRGKE